MSKYDELKRLAEAANAIVGDVDFHFTIARAGGCDQAEVDAVAAFLGKANPAAILELIAENSSLKDLLAQAAATIRSADVETGVCCCGSPVETHGFGDGHSPVDQGGYYALDLLSRIEAAMQEASHV